MAITARYVGSLGGTPGALARMTAQQSGYANSWNDVIWHQGSGLPYSNGRFTITKTGDYWIAANAVADVNGVAYRMRIAVDATIVREGPTTAGGCTVVHQATLTSGQQVRIEYYPQSGTASMRTIRPESHFAIVPV